jgi:D-glycerate 3-kinase
VSFGLSMQASLWPTELAVLDASEYRDLAARLRPALHAELLRHQLDRGLEEPLSRVYLPLAAWVVRQRSRERPLILGVNGAQGSGKSTLGAFLGLILREGFGLRTTVLSIDDFYRTHGERERLGREIHPLLVTRGVPGTHDLALAADLLDRLTRGAGPVAVPCFDKAKDERRPESEWPVVEAPVDVLIFEGWCVGARPQPESELAEPLNELETLDDDDGTWRDHVNGQLKGAYADLFARLDRLIMLRVPNLECIYEWRSLQEEKLARGESGGERARILDSSGLKRFIMHYERLTRHMLDEMPDRADLVLYLDEQHQFTAILTNRQ